MSDKTNFEVGDAVQIIEHLFKGANLGALAGVTEEQREAIYSIGHFQYSNGKFYEACKLFQLLVLLDSLDRRAVKALGSCLQMLKKYEEAMQFLGIAMLMEPEDPTSGIQIAECLIALGDKKKAIEILKTIQKEFGQHKKFDHSVKKVNSLLEIIN